MGVGCPVAVRESTGEEGQKAMEEDCLDLARHPHPQRQRSCKMWGTNRPYVGRRSHSCHPPPPATALRTMATEVKSMPPETTPGEDPNQRQDTSTSPMSKEFCEGERPHSPNQLSSFHDGGTPRRCQECGQRGHLFNQRAEQMMSIQVAPP